MYVNSLTLPISLSLYNERWMLKNYFIFRTQIGYCPQFDALFDYLTVKEHLELYARIKGVVDHRIDNVSGIYLELTFDACLHALMSSVIPQ